MITREELLASPEYWTTRIQMELYAIIEHFMDDNHLTRAELAALLGVTKGYITQVLSGDFDHRLSKLVELSLAVGYAPQITYVPMEKVFLSDTQSVNNFSVSPLNSDTSDVNFKKRWNENQKEQPIEVNQYSATHPGCFDSNFAA